LIELTKNRTKTMKVFDKGKNERLYRCHIGNIHYPDTSKVFQDIDTTLLSRTGGLYQDKCFYNSELPDKADGNFVFFNRDHNFDLRVVGVSSVGHKPTPDIWGTLGKGIEYTDAFGSGIHLEIKARIGNFDVDLVPPRQWQLCLTLVRALVDVLRLSVDNIYGHNQFANYKSCPGKNWSMDKFREELVFY